MWLRSRPAMDLLPSPMPPGLINGMNKDEVLDLFAYLLSAGNPNDKAFAK